MKTTLVLDDENRQAKLLLQNVVHPKITLRATEAVAGCNCDRWGHPCPGCNEPKVQPKAQFSISAPAKQTK